MAGQELERVNTPVDAKARTTEAPASHEHGAESMPGRITSPAQALRLLRLPRFAEHASNGMRSALLHEIQQKFGNRFAMRVLSEAQGTVTTGGMSKLDIPIGEGEPLPAAHQGAFEQALGQPLDHVRVHTGADADQAADSLGAEAFTVGSDIYFSNGAYAPGTTEGDTRLGHELIHVSQHAAGRVPSLSSRHDSVSKPTDPLEQEAYAGEGAVGRRVSALRDARNNGDHIGTSLGPSNINGHASVAHRRGANAILRDDSDSEAQRVQTLRNNFYEAITAGSWGEAAEFLNGFNDDDIRRMLKDLTSEQLEKLRKGALESMPEWSDRIVLPLEEIVRQRNEPERIAKLERDYNDAIAREDWKQAAILLNAFNDPDIKKKSHALTPFALSSIRDAAPDWATRVIRPLEAIVGPRSVPTQAAVPENKEKPISEMTEAEKLLSAYRRARIDAAFRAKIESLITPKALVIAIVSFAVVFVASQFTPVGWATDIGLVLTAIFIGSAIWAAAKGLVRFAEARNATTPEELDDAGEGLAEAAAEVGVDAIILFVTHGIGGGPKGGVPFKGTPQTAIRFAVQDDGTLVAVAAETVPTQAATIGVAEAAKLGAKAVPAGVTLMQAAGGPEQKPPEPKPSVEAWAKSLPKRPAQGSGAAQEFQIKQCGPEESQVSGGGKQVWADGIKTDAAQLQEAKYVGNPDRSPFVEGSEIPDYIREDILDKLDDEFTRYAAVINDQATPVSELEVITNERRAVPFFEKLLAKHGIKGRVTVRK